MEVVSKAYNGFRITTDKPNNQFAWGKPLSTWVVPASQCVLSLNVKENEFLPLPAIEKAGIPKHPRPKTKNAADVVSRIPWIVQIDEDRLSEAIACQRQQALGR